MNTSIGIRLDIWHKNNQIGRQSWLYLLLGRSIGWHRGKSSFGSPLKFHRSPWPIHFVVIKQWNHYKRETLRGDSFGMPLAKYSEHDKNTYSHDPRNLRFCVFISCTYHTFHHRCPPIFLNKQPIVTPIDLHGPSDRSVSLIFVIGGHPDENPMR